MMPDRLLHALMMAALLGALAIGGALMVGWCGPIDLPASWLKGSIPEQ